YDYIIIGGGLSGMTLANRLSEDPSKTILVLEAGGFHSNDPIVAIPGLSGSAFGNATLDWDFSTIPQPNSNNNTYTWHRGKGLGGSTLINLMAWGRPALPEIDAMGNLGNPGWTGENLFKYMRKAENFTKPPQAFAIENNLTYITAAHGNSGPLFSSFSNFISAAQAPWLSVLNSLGVAHNQDALSGSDVGVWMAPATVNAQRQIRSDAASAYYIPVSGRANLVVETGAEVLKIVLDSGSHENVRASQVQYIQGGQTLTVNVTEGAEVILSASAVKTPQLLELSGIGDPDILEPLGIDVKVNLPGVGAGVIDQVYLGVSYGVEP
ncbi:glucose-methanol-choline oxidoreductase, partial [Rhodocollybia butyracea]